MLGSLLHPVQYLARGGSSEMFIKTESVQCFTFGKEYSYHAVTADFVVRRYSRLLLRNGRRDRSNV